MAALWSLISLLLGLEIIGLVVSDLFSLAGLPSEPSLFIVALTLVLAGAVRRRLRAAHTVVLVVMLVALISSALLVYVAWDSPEWLTVEQVNGWTRDYIEIRSGVAFNLVALSIQTVVFIALLLSRSAFPARLQKGSLRPDLDLWGVMARVG